MYVNESKGMLPVGKDPTGALVDFDYTYSAWGGKSGVGIGGFNFPAYKDKLINPYIAHNRETSTTDDAATQVFLCPSDIGAGAGDYPQPRFPTLYDFWGSSYFYNASANNNDPYKGLFRKKVTQIRNPTRVVLVNDWPFNVHFANANEFSKMYWHEKRERGLGWGNVLFVDGHVAFLQATKDRPDFQNGPDWSFVYDAR